MKYIILLLCFPFFALAQAPATDFLTKNYASLEELYQYLHLHPEVSLMETATAGRMAVELAKAGYKVDQNIAKTTGIVATLQNGKGPTILIRTDMDALPIKEETTLPYASTVRMKDSNGKEVDAMHACGHDVHMSVWVGTARALAQMKDKWKGTLLFVAQSAEEIVVGAKAMMDAKIYDKYGKPDYCLALHVSSSIPAGQVAYCPEYFMANVNSIDITVYGEGGHGAYPHLTKDPVVMASRLVLDLQTIVSREISVLEPAVLTVGTIHGGTKRNIIPNEVKLECTLRTYDDKVRDEIIRKIQVKANAAAMSAGMSPEKYPKVFLTPESSPYVYNDAELTNRLAKSFEKSIGKTNVQRVPPVMVSEDFGYFGKTEPKTPICMYWLGSVDPKTIERSKKENIGLPTLHSSKYQPLPKPTIETGVNTMVGAVLELAK